MTQGSRRGWHSELTLLVAKADQELEPVGQSDRVDHRCSRRDCLDRPPFGDETGDAGVLEIVLKLGLLELLKRIARFPEERRRPSRIAGSPTQQQVAVFKVDRAKRDPIGGTAVAILKAPERMNTLPPLRRPLGSLTSSLEPPVMSTAPNLRTVKAGLFRGSTGTSPIAAALVTWIAPAGARRLPPVIDTGPLTSPRV